MKMRTCVHVLSAVLALTGCRSIGPSAIRRGHADFNGAIAQTLDEQLLLNVVRARYLEPAFFLDVGNVTDSRRVALNVGTDDSVVYVHNHGRTSEWNPTANFELSQNPSVVYLPLQGQRLVKQLAAPVPLPVLLNAVQSGWSVRRVFGIFVERMGNLSNAPSASGPTPVRMPEWVDFSRSLALMESLVRGGVLTLDVDPADSGRLAPRLDSDSRLAVAAAECRDLLDLPSDGRTGSVRLRTRSMQSTLFFLANGVQIPKDHQDKGIVPITRTATGDAFDWTSVLEGQFTVRCSPHRPTDAFLAVPYRGHWFFIADWDLDTKSTFLLLMNTFNLQAGDPALAISR
ncbi:MAG: hypothetical protein LBT98_01890 [Puniceicoccales bacterium]|jgi:hypothetical protein|nr:hypothetical protein [Puniceicoccales bacterium]